MKGEKERRTEGVKKRERKKMVEREGEEKRDRSKGE